MTKEVQTMFVSTTEPANLAFSTAIDGKNKFGDDPVYMAMVEFAADAADLKLLKQTAAQVARQAYPGVDLKTLQFPFKRAKNDPNKAVITARSDYAPSLSVLENGKMRDLTSPVDLKQYRKWFFGGAQVLIGVTFRPYEAKGEKGVSAKLGMILSVKPSESGGGRSSAEVFKGYVGTVSDEDPGFTSKGLDDEISF